MAETICEAVKPRSHKLTRGFSILMLLIMMRMVIMMTRMMMMIRMMMIMMMKKPESKVILSDVEASRVESVDSRVVAIKSGQCH